MTEHQPPRPAPRLVSVPRRDSPVPPSDVVLDGDDDERPRSVLQRLDSIEVSVRALTARGEETKQIVDERIDRTEEYAAGEFRRLNGKLDEVLDVVRRLDARPDHSLALGHLAELVGQPPQTIDPRTSSVDQLTADELTDLELKGTGLFRLVGQLARSDRTIIGAIASAAGRAAGTRSAIVTSITATAPSWAPLLYEALSKLF